MSGEELQAATGAPVEQGAVWRRQHPRMLLVELALQLGKFLWAVIALFVVGTRGEDGPWWLGPLGILGVAVLGVLGWFTTYYRVSDAQLQLRTGFFNRKITTTRVELVRTVDVTASLLHRVLGLAKVKIGTGADDIKFELDGLTSAQAEALRERLIHLRNRTESMDERAVDGDVTQPVESTPTEGDVEIARLNPAWIRYALLTSTGLVSAAAIFGVGWQVIERVGFDLIDSGVRQGEEVVRDLGLVVVVGVSTLLAMVLVLVLSLVGYVLSFWNYRLTRNHRGGTLQVSRGLFTTRAVTVEERRLRGVEMAETIAMRPVKGAQLKAITTGLGTEAGDSDMLVPPAPRAVVVEVADAVLALPGTLSLSLNSHGPAAARRRMIRALTGGVVMAGIVVGATFWLLPALGALALIPLLTAPWLGRDRARSLGHLLTDRYLVSRKGAIVRTTSVVERTGVIGVTVRESLFQRRAGLATITMATAAGSESYTVVDVPAGDGRKLAADLLPGHLDPLVRS